jgi:hypothetical protein
MIRLNGDTLSQGIKWLEENGDCVSEAGHCMCIGERRQCIERQ